MEIEKSSQRTILADETDSKVNRTFVKIRKENTKFSICFELFFDQIWEKFYFFFHDSHRIDSYLSKLEGIFFNSLISILTKSTQKFHDKLISHTILIVFNCYQQVTLIVEWNFIKKYIFTLMFLFLNSEE